MKFFKKVLAPFFVVSFVATLLAPSIGRAANDVVDITFPVLGEVTFSDDFTSARSGGRTHDATDIMSAKMTPVVAVADGVIRFAPMDEPSYGYILRLDADDGYSYAYIHLNNDTPGTDDGLGGPEHAYAPGIDRGTRVTRGQHIAWVGDSGNAEDVGSHLHFEMYDEDGDVINPYLSLLAAHAAISYDPNVEALRSPTINDDKDIPEATGPVFCTSDSLIRTPEVSTVYYCGRNGGRYVFQNESTFFSWYKDFSSVVMVTSEEMAAIPLKGVVTYKPGSYMVKILSVPNIYAVAKGGTLRWVPSPDIAESLYGISWAKQVRDIPDGFFGAYKVGGDVTRN